MSKNIRAAPELVLANHSIAYINHVSNQISFDLVHHLKYVYIFWDEVFNKRIINSFFLYKDKLNKVTFPSIPPPPPTLSLLSPTSRNAFKLHHSPPPASGFLEAVVLGAVGISPTTWAILYLKTPFSSYNWNIVRCNVTPQHPPTHLVPHGPNEVVSSASYWWLFCWLRCITVGYMLRLLLLLTKRHVDDP